MSTHLNTFATPLPHPYTPHHTYTHLFTANQTSTHRFTRYYTKINLYTPVYTFLHQNKPLHTTPHLITSKQPQHTSPQLYTHHITTPHNSTFRTMPLHTKFTPQQSSTLLTTVINTSAYFTTPNYYSIQLLTKLLHTTGQHVSTHFLHSSLNTASPAVELILTSSLPITKKHEVTEQSSKKKI